jgi:hypothetical protein
MFVPVDWSENMTKAGIAQMKKGPVQNRPLGSVVKLSWSGE